MLLLWNIVEKSREGPPILIAFQTMENRRKSNKTHAFCQTKTAEIGVAN